MQFLTIQRKLRTKLGMKVFRGKQEEERFSVENILTIVLKVYRHKLVIS